MIDSSTETRTSGAAPGRWSRLVTAPTLPQSACVSLRRYRSARKGPTRTAEVPHDARDPGAQRSRGVDMKVAIKASNGQFVCAEGGGGRELVANRAEAGV